MEETYISFTVLATRITNATALDSVAYLLILLEDCDHISLLRLWMFISSPPLLIRSSNEARKGFLSIAASHHTKQ